ncbi:sulfite exporter TauE/SafE family protein [Terasakiella sp. SH-1]|uniref:sulfite exporter TauE/SafE family protein n=1 Tax=Terasakiella sp. SH-1 TaxID=2560057 RepID=UPI0010731E75|nr:sulfite exporter TauE/SafE family protein [Terasakiella sp. SH-1]
MMDSLFWAAVLIFLCAGTIKGTVGIGLPTASISVLTQFYDPHSAIALVIFPIMISNIWQVYRTGESLRVLREYWLFGLMLMVFILIFTNMSTTIPVKTLMIILGSVVVLFALSSLFIHPPKLPHRFDKSIQFIAGSLAGGMGGLTAIWSPPMVIYLVSKRLEKDDFVRASGLLITMGSLPLLAGYWINGLMTGPLALTSLSMMIPTLIGFSLGEMLRKKVNGEVFQKVLLIIFLLMGLNIIRRALF